MRRREELDAMSEDGKESDIMRSLDEHVVIRIHNRQQLAFWGATVNRLIDDGKVDAEFVELEQESYWVIRKAKKWTA